MTSISTDRLREIAADSVMYVCADCERAENHEAMCHNFDFVSIIGGEVICNSCADDGHNGEPRLPVPNLALALRASKPEVERLDDMAKAYILEFRRIFPGSGWPTLEIAKKLISAAIEGEPR